MNNMNATEAGVVIMTSAQESLITAAMNLRDFSKDRREIESRHPRPALPHLRKLAQKYEVDAREVWDDEYELDTVLGDYEDNLGMIVNRYLAKALPEVDEKEAGAAVADVMWRYHGRDQAKAFEMIRSALG